MINTITVTMAVGGGTSTAGQPGPSHGGTSNSGNKLGDTMSQIYFLNLYMYNMQNVLICAICKICKIDSMQNIHKVCKKYTKKYAKKNM